MSQEKRIKIAEALGWKPGEDDRMRDGTYRWDTRNNGVIFGCAPLRYEEEPCEIYGYLVDQQVLDYFKCLNACRKFEKFLRRDPILWQKYVDKLNETLSLDDAIHASCEERCEAFGKTLGLW